jgi:hypothetical protein
MQSMARPAQDHNVYGKLMAESLIGAMVDLEAIAVRDIKRAAVTGALKRRCSRPTPLRRTEILGVGHGLQLAQSTAVHLGICGWRRGLERGTRQSPHPAARVLEKPIVLEIRQSPRQLMLNEGRIVGGRRGGSGGGRLTRREPTVSKRPFSDRVAVRLTSQRTQAVKRRGARLAPKFTALPRV